MNARTYHVAVGFPADVPLWTARIPLDYGKHCRARASRYAQTMPLPTHLDTTQATCVEIEVQAGRVVKALYRFAYTENSDLCLVVTMCGFVKTAWLNSKDDDHSTLDASKYETPES